MKTLSCGLIIVNEHQEILMGKVTGQKIYDLPKGGQEEGETPMETMIREVHEEFGLVVDPDLCCDLGEHPYNKEKRLHLFITATEKDLLDLNSLKCTTFFPHHVTGDMIPEINGYAWIKFEDVPKMCSKSMSRVLTPYINLMKELHDEPDPIW